VNQRTSSRPIVARKLRLFPPAGWFWSPFIPCGGTAIATTARFRAGSSRSPAARSSTAPALMAYSRWDASRMAMAAAKPIAGLMAAHMWIPPSRRRREQFTMKSRRQGGGRNMCMDWRELQWWFVDLCFGLSARYSVCPPALRPKLPLRTRFGSFVRRWSRCGRTMSGA